MDAKNYEQYQQTAKDMQRLLRNNLADAVLIVIKYVIYENWGYELKFETSQIFF